MEGVDIKPGRETDKNEPITERFSREAKVVTLFDWMLFYLCFFPRPSGRTDRKREVCKVLAILRRGLARSSTGSAPRAVRHPHSRQPDTMRRRIGRQSTADTSRAAFPGGSAAADGSATSSLRPLRSPITHLLYALLAPSAVAFHLCSLSRFLQSGPRPQKPVKP